MCAPPPFPFCHLGALPAQPASVRLIRMPAAICTSLKASRCDPSSVVYNQPDLPHLPNNSQILPSSIGTLPQRASAMSCSLASLCPASTACGVNNMQKQHFTLSPPSPAFIDILTGTYREKRHPNLPTFRQRLCPNLQPTCKSWPTMPKLLPAWQEIYIITMR